MRLLLISLLALGLCGCSSTGRTHPQPDTAGQRGDEGTLTPEASYRRGMELRDANEFDDARRYMLSAAERGHAEAQFELGLWYMTGNRGVPVDFNQAALWVEKAAETGQRDALTYIWQLYFFGKGVGQSDAKAYAWLQRSAGTGDPEASYRLGLFHYEGIATPEDHAEAAVWFLDAADSGVPGACYYLGVMHLDGDGVQQSDEDAFYWFERGAAADHPASMLAMGDLYQDGRGVEKNTEQAKSWYRKAFAQDTNPEVQIAAEERLKQLEANDEPH
ncbi:MAG: sel1 repeat family protein [Planctomycetes bacterium]|nr:sel1 repeat family protein [Planctomycetota bacterium]